MSEIEQTPLARWAHIFDFRWSPDQPIRERQKKVVRKALVNSTYDFNRWDASRGKVTVQFTPMSGNEVGGWNDRTLMLSINEKFGTRKSWPTSYGAEIMQHEMGHVTDTLVLTDSTRDRIVNVWCPPIPGQSTHGWWAAEYQLQVGEAFADGWAHVYSGKVIGPPRKPLYRFFRFNRKWGHHKLTPDVKAVIREVCE